MTTELLKLRKIISKCFRKAKRWYAGYIALQLIVLIFAIVAIFAELSPNLSAVVAFIAVLVTEIFRWRSDCWKSEAETALRKWEIADGLGVAVDSAYIADWLAAKPKGFLDDVSDAEMEGSRFDSGRERGVHRLVKNLRESAWWTKHLASRTAIYLGVILIVLLVSAFVALTFCIGALKNTNLGSIAVVQNLGGILCSVLVFVFSINLVRLLMEFGAVASVAKEALDRCAELASRADLSDRDALCVLHDYQTARNSAPLLPTFIWKWHGKHLREQWAHFNGEATR